MNMSLQMARQCMQTGQYNRAEGLLKQVLKEDPDNAEANFSMGILCEKFNRMDISIPLFKKSIDNAPGNIEAYFKLSVALFTYGNHEALEKILESIPQVDPGNVVHLVRLGLLFRRLHDHQREEQAYLQAIEFDPNYYQAWANLATVQLILGKLEEAQESARRAIDINPQKPAGYYTLTHLAKLDPGSSEVEALEAIYEKANANTEDKMQAAYALGRVLDAAGEHDRAFEFMAAANDAGRQMSPPSEQSDTQLFDLIEAQIAQSFFTSAVSSGSNNDQAIFVVGMPRSGTTLVEQILASHPLVAGAGELEAMRSIAIFTQTITGKPFPQSTAELNSQQLAEISKLYLKQLNRHTGNAKRVVDKMPYNFLYVGLIKMLFPAAKIINCQRDPKDICISIYKNRFESNHSFTHDLTALVDYYRRYERLMSYWNKVFPYQIYNIQYEDLVVETEEEVRALLSYCGLPFDSQCLDFHRLDRPVATVSSEQVRQPINSGAIGKWKAYRKHLKPLLDAWPDADAQG